MSEVVCNTILPSKGWLIHIFLLVFHKYHLESVSANYISLKTKKKINILSCFICSTLFFTPRFFLVNSLFFLLKYMEIHGKIILSGESSRIVNWVLVLNCWDFAHTQSLFCTEVSRCRVTASQNFWAIAFLSSWVWHCQWEIRCQSCFHAFL